VKRINKDLQDCLSEEEKAAGAVAYDYDPYFSRQRKMNKDFLDALRDAIDAADELGVIYNPICDCGLNIREMFVEEEEK